MGPNGESISENRCGPRKRKAPEKPGLLTIAAKSGTGRVGDTGFEPPANSSGKTELGDVGGAVSAENGPLEPDLATIIEAWPRLPESIKADISAMVGGAGKMS